MVKAYLKERVIQSSVNTFKGLSSDDNLINPLQDIFSIKGQLWKYRPKDFR